MIFHDYAFITGVFCFVLITVWILFKIKNPYIEALKAHNQLMRDFYNIVNMYPKVVDKEVSLDSSIPVKLIYGVGLEDHCCGKEFIVLIDNKSTADKLYFKCTKCGKLMAAVYE